MLNIVTIDSCDSFANQHEIFVLKGWKKKNNKPFVLQLFVSRAEWEVEKGINGFSKREKNNISRLYYSAI